MAERLGARIEIGGGTAAGALLAVRRLAEAGADRIVSFGLAGGLSPSLRAGDVLVPSHALLDGRLVETDPDLNAALGGTTGHRLLAGDAVAATIAEKRRLRETTGADAVDLETAAVMRAGLPFAALRAICDEAGRDLPPAALAALGQDGRVGLFQVAASAARRPGQIPALIGLGRDAARARAALLRHRLGAPPQSTGGR